jgi:hypothetical protein
MGLAEFHEIFIALSIALCVFVAAWAAQAWAGGGGAAAALAGAAALCGGAGLWRYRAWFRRLHR